MKSEFLRQIFEKYSKSNFMKIHPVGAELYEADRRTDTTKLIVALRKFFFAGKPKNSIKIKEILRI